MVGEKILVVDDEEDVREVIKLHLEREKYQILEAENGEVAIKILQMKDFRNHINLILCDIRMPRFNGIELIDYLRIEAPHIPVVVVTGYLDTELIDSLVSKGIKAYLLKPFEKEKLLNTINKLVSPHKDIDNNPSFSCY